MRGWYRVGRGRQKLEVLGEPEKTFVRRITMNANAIEIQGKTNVTAETMEEGQILVDMPMAGILGEDSVESESETID